MENETKSAPSADAPSREQLDASTGPLLVEFGTGWCPHCLAAQPLIAAALARHPRTRHLRIEDGRGQRLGRSYAVKLWPTLIFLADGKEQARLVRPTDGGEIERELERVELLATGDAP